MSKSYPMTSPRLLVSIEAFKRRINALWSVDLSDALNVSHKQHGSRHFVTVGDLSLQFSVKRRTRVIPTTAIEAPVEPAVKLSADRLRFVK